MKIEETILTPRDGLKKSIIAIGQSLIERADDIARDIKNVASVTIYAQLNPTEIVNFDVTKNYNATFHELVGDEDEIVDRNIHE